MQKLTIIDSVDGIKTLTDYLSDKEFVAYDVETTGTSKQSEIIGYSICASEDEAFYVILSKWDVESQKLHYFQDNITASKSLVEQLTHKQLLMHNAVFDCMLTEAYFKIKLIDALHTDTMILAHLLDENRKVGLKELGRTMYGQTSTTEQEEMKESVAKNGGKLTKSDYEMYKADSYLLGKYGAKDALLTYKLFTDLVPQLYEQNLDKFFYEDESMPLLKGPTYQLNNTGLQVDTKALSVLKKTLEAECLEAKAFIHQEIEPYVKDKYPGTNKKNTFNIGSSQQLSWLLFGKLELEFSLLTKGGKDACRSLGLPIPYTYGARKNFIHESLRLNGLAESRSGKKIREPWAYIACDKKTLTKLAPKFKWIEKLLEYQRKTKLLSTYIKGIESRIKYNVIHPSFLQHGTTSGRYSSRNPNWQNLPRDDKRIKECIVPRPGKIFVGADQSQLEPRVFAYYSQDPRLMASFESEDDFYSVIGMEVYGKTDCIPRKDGSPDAFGIKYKRLRDLSKVIALASTYGATAFQLSSTTGKSADDTQMDIDEYFERFPGVKQFQIESHAFVRNKGFVSSLYGRIRRLNEAKLIPNAEHSELPYEARNILNLAVNHRIQSTGASIVNRAAIAFFNNAKEAGIECQIVNQVHDSLIIECNEADAENISLLLQDAMENTITLKGVKLEAIPKIGKSFAEV